MFLEPTSILTAKKIANWKRKRKLYNFKKLPKVAIIGPDLSLSRSQKYLQSKKIKGLVGKNYLYKSQVLVCSGFGTGAPAIVSLLEELLVLGVQKFIFVGVAGILKKNISPNTPYLIEEAYSTLGTTCFYMDADVCKPIQNTWMDAIKETLNMPVAKIWSTDCPYRETRSLVEKYTNLNCNFVEMEIAGIYAFANYYKISAAAIVLGADNLSTGKWIPPENFSELETNKNKLRNDLLEFCIKYDNKNC